MPGGELTVPLHPEAKRYLAKAAKGTPPRSAMTVEQTREFYRGMAPLAGEPPDLPSVSDASLPGPGGEILVRIYRPSERENLPVLAYFHGGRFFSGDLETHDGLCRILAAQSGWILAAVDYRLAPEHPFPAAVEDAVAATRWLLREGGTIGGSPARVGVGGDSAGGNLAAVAAAAVRDESPALACQMLIYPMLDATRGMGSHELVGRGYGAGSEDMERGYREYLPEGVDRRDPRVSPLWNQDLSGLPPAYVLTAEYDSLRDEGEAYARALAEADVPVTAARFPGMIHGFFQLGGVFTEGRRANRQASEFLRAVAAT